MKLFSYLIALSFFASCTFSKKQVNCEKYRNGEFIYIPKGQGEYIYHITRDGNIQTETEQGTDEYSKFSLHWVDDCTYEVLLIDASYHFSDSIEKIRRSVPFYAEILSGTKDYYVFRGGRRNSKVVITDTMWVIH